VQFIYMFVATKTSIDKGENQLIIFNTGSGAAARLEEWEEEEEEEEEEVQEEEVQEEEEELTQTGEGNDVL